MRRRGREFLMNTSQRRGVNLELVTDSPQGHKSQKPPNEGWFFERVNILIFMGSLLYLHTYITV